MRWYHVVFVGLFGGAAGVALAVFVIFACSATVGTPDLETAVPLAYITVFVGAVGGASAALLLWAHARKPPPV